MLVIQSVPTNNGYVIFQNNFINNFFWIPFENIKEIKRILDFADPPRLWEDRSRRRKKIFQNFQKFFKSILSNLNAGFDRLGKHLSITEGHRKEATNC